MASFIPNVTDVFPEPTLYRPDFSYIDSMLRRRTSMYERGFQELAGKYKFISREVTNPYNALERDKFVGQALDNLKNLSSMDLSQQKNVDSASKVFEPFVKNSDILGDMALTSHWNQQESIAESYRLKDGGKEFSQKNLDYVRKQRAEFASADPTQWQSYYAKRRSYSPYYDWNKEFKEWFKDYKPNNITIERRNGLYNVTESNKGASAQDLKMFFSSIASDKAKEQMRIEAAVTIGDNVEQVLPSYIKAVEADIKSLSGQLNQLETSFKLTENPAEKEKLKLAIRATNSQLSSMQGTLDKVKSGDVEYVRANAENISFALYFDQAVTKLANGLSWTDYTRTIKGDDVAMMMWKDAQEWARLRFKEDREDKRKLLELEGGPDKLTQISLPGDLSGKKEPDSLASLDQQEIEVKNRQVQLHNLLTNTVASRTGKRPDQITESDIKAFIDNEKKKGIIDPNYQNYLLGLEKVQIDLDNIDFQRQAAHRFAINKLGKDFENLQGYIEKFKRRQPQSGITASEMLDAVMKGKASLTPAMDESGRGLGGGVYDLTINGRTRRVNSGVFGTDPVVKLYNDANKLASTTGAKQYSAALTEYFGQESLIGVKALSVNPSGKKYKQISGNIAPVVGVSPNDISSIMITGKGDAYFTVQNSSFDKDPEAASKVMTERLTALGFETTYNKSLNMFYVKPKPGLSKVDFGLNLYSGFNQTEMSIMEYAENKAGNGWQSPHFQPGGRFTDVNGKRVPSFYTRTVVNDAQRMHYLYSDATGNTPLKISSDITDIMNLAKEFAETASISLPAVNK